MTLQTGDGLRGAVGIGSNSVGTEGVTHPAFDTHTHTSAVFTMKGAVS